LFKRTIDYRKASETGKPLNSSFIRAQEAFGEEQT
jgi:hypothetical protein